MQTHFSNETIDSRDFSEERLNEYVFYNCTLNGCRFNGTDLRNAEFENCRFLECDLSNPLIDQAVFNDIHFENSKIMGMSFYLCRQMTFDLSFNKSRIANCNFSNLILKKSQFLDCEITDCYYQESNLEEVSFKDSHFKNTLFHKAKLKNASFVNASGYDIDPNNNEIKGAEFSVPDVLNLLGNFGIKIVNSQKEDI